jgi:VWFA-related protein
LRASRFLLGALLLSAPVAVSLPAISSRAFASFQAQDQPPPPTFRTEANYVRVDVYPTRNEAPVADLTQDDFEVLDNGTPQKIEQFERVVVRAAGPQETRIEPNTVRESRSMLESSRSRVFVLFLDIYHVGVDGSHNIRKPLVDALDKVIGADDLVGVMTPEMSAGDIAFARKTTTINGILARYWYWGERDRLNPVDPEEQLYQQCYPAIGETAGIAAEMIKRRHEKRTIDALEDLVTFLRGVREERKAVLAITEGWLLYRPNPVLARPIGNNVPSGPIIGIDPRGGKIATTAPKGGSSGIDCEGDRVQLSQIDDEQQFRRMLDEANRANTSFYPVDPRGLVVFDTPIGPDPPPSIFVDQKMLQTRIGSLRTLADFTDGLAIVSSNNIAAGLKRVVDDLTSYYLLGYYATGKLDGKFHSITVRVKRPGVRVRARRGYLAATEAAANAAANAAARANAASSSSPAPAAAAEARAIDVVLSPLDGYTRQLPIRMHAAAGWMPRNAAAVWTVGELGAGPEWRGGADADVSLASPAGATLATTRAHVDPGTRAFRIVLAPDQGLAPGDYLVRVRVKSADGVTSASDTLRIALPAAPDATGAIFVRRGPVTANREVATSDLRFRRSEQIRVEMPSPSNAAFTARLLDRTGKPLAVPVTSTVRDDADGSRWQVAQVALAPLAPSDYLIEIVEAGGEGRAGAAGGEIKRTLFAFRVIP